MSKIVLFHGSSEIVKNPTFGKGKPYNDYGKGFYCTEQLELAKEWASNRDGDGYVNHYEIDTSSLCIMDLSSEEYSILHWLAVLMEHREVRLSTPVMKRGKEWLRQHYLIDMEKYDVIIGYRADDSYFSYARAFVNNEISLAQLSYAMKLGKLGEQFVLKSHKAFDNIKFLAHEVVDSNKYYPKRIQRDEKARADFLAMLEKEDVEGIYMRDIIRLEVKPDDSCLR